MTNTEKFGFSHWYPERRLTTLVLDREHQCAIRNIAAISAKSMC